jgi:predicted GNAT family acetyltransferase
MNEVPAEVRHDAPRNRFSVELEGHESVIEYRPVDGGIAITHTFVPPKLRGRGIAELLARAALDYARSRNFRVVPQCSYVARFIERHREFQDLVE